MTTFHSRTPAATIARTTAYYAAAVAYLCRVYPDAPWLAAAVDLAHRDALMYAAGPLLVEDFAEAMASAAARLAR